MFAKSSQASASVMAITKCLNSGADCERVHTSDRERRASVPAHGQRLTAEKKIMILRSKKTDHTSKLDHTARELSEDELALVSGGKKSGSSQVDYLTVVVKEAVITNVSF